VHLRFCKSILGVKQRCFWKKLSRPNSLAIF
jgi:hypothetical protein